MADDAEKRLAKITRPFTGSAKLVELLGQHLEVGIERQIVLLAVMTGRIVKFEVAVGLGSTRVVFEFHRAAPSSDLLQGCPELRALLIDN